jgi:hypothetical protein
MKKILIFVFCLINASIAVTLGDLLNNDACRWGYNTDMDGTGCPDFFKKKCSNVNTKWSNEKKAGKEIFVLKWNTTERSSTNVLDGQVKFVANNTRNGVELILFEGKLNCRGSDCDALQNLMYSTFQKIGLKNPLHSGFWNKSFSVGIDSAEYNTTREGYANWLAFILYNVKKERKVSPGKWDFLILDEFIAPLTREVPCLE